MLVIIHVYMFEFFFSLIDFKHHYAKSKSQLSQRKMSGHHRSASQLVHAMSILIGCEILCYLLIMFRYQVPTLIFFILQYKDNSLLNQLARINSQKTLHEQHIFAILLMQPNYLLVSYMVMYAIDFFFIRQSAHKVDHKYMYK